MTLIGAMPEIPKHPTPWESDGTMIYDANGGLVFYTGTDVDRGDASDLTAQIADLVNAHHAPPVHLSPEDEVSEDKKPAHLRVFRDRDTPRTEKYWYEVVPGVFWYAPTRQAAQLSYDHVEGGASLEGIKFYDVEEVKE